MRDRRPADRYIDPYYGSSRGAVARSPAEVLEPTRPPPRPRRPLRPQRRTPLLRFVSGLFTLALLAAMVVGALALILQHQLDTPGPLARNKVIVIPKGEGTHEIAARLEREGVVSDRRLFIAGYLWNRLSSWLENEKATQLKAGDFEMRQGVSVREAVDLLLDGRTISYKVTVPEGLTSHQIVERLKSDPNLSGEIAAVPPEGSLLPETFAVQRGAARQAIVDNMQAEARKLLDKAWAQRKKDLPLKTPEEALVLASIVEKETGRNDERDRVAAVFINRLRQNMRLQSDPTILYGLFGGKTAWNRAILRSEIAQKNSHNTYQIDGLPPTPICNPGRASIEAVLNPADTKELYFVADGSGGHVFAETLKEHNTNVLKWRAFEKDMRAKAAAAAAASQKGDTPTTAAPPPASAPAPKANGAARAQPQKAQAAPGPNKEGQDSPGDAAVPQGGQSWAPATTPADPAPKAKR